jgi:signal peptidase I
VILVLRCAYGIKNPFGPGYFVRWAAPRLGEVVAAPNPRDGRTVVKRVAAVGPVRLVVAAGALVGPLIDAPLDAGRSAELGDSLFVPAGSVLLLGDNVAESVDSRDYGPVSIDLIFGRVCASRLRTAP